MTSVRAARHGRKKVPATKSGKGRGGAFGGGERPDVRVAHGDSRRAVTCDSYSTRMSSSARSCSPARRPGERLNGRGNEVSCWFPKRRSRNWTMGCGKPSHRWRKREHWQARRGRDRRACSRRTRRGRLRRGEKNATPGGGQAFRVPLIGCRKTRHQPHQPLISSAMLAEVPLAGLSFRAP